MVVKVENVLIIGSGIMGCGIAQCTAMAGKFKSIVVQDISEKQLEVAKSQMAGSLQRMKKIKRECECDYRCTLTLHSELQRLISGARCSGNF